MFKRLAIITAALSASAVPAFAHVGAEHGSLAAGLAHPMTGLDHLLAMLAVGLWAASLQGSARIAAPAGFVVAMIAGFGLALAGVTLPFVEPAILASVIGLGLIVALAVRLPAAAAIGVVSAFAVFHGHAHGAELGAASALVFGLGFALSTAALHGAGFVAARLASAPMARVAGIIVAATGTVLAIG